MIIDGFAIKGILRFQNTLDIDLRDVPPGIVAFVGENGEGKTTALGCPLATFFRSLPDREHKEIAKFADDSRDSFLETRFSVEGRGQFRARVNVDGLKRNADAIFEQIGPDGMRTVLNDGKVSTYDAVIARELPTREQMLASTYASQDKSGAFHKISQKDRKQLVMGFLGLERYEAMSERAKKVAGLTEACRGRIAAVRDRLQRDTDPAVLAAIDARAKELQTAGVRAEVSEVGLREELAVLESRLALVSDTTAAYNAALLRGHDLQKQVTAREQELRVQAVRVVGNEKAYQDEVAQIGADAEASRRRLTHEADNARADLTERLTNNRATLDQAETIRAAVARVAVLEQAIAEERRRLDMQRRVHEEVREQLRLLDNELARLSRVEAELDRARQDAALLQTVPFGKKCADAACQFVGNAVAAKARLPILEAEMVRRPAVRDRRERLLSAGNAVAKATAGIDATIAEHETERTGQTVTASLVGKLEAAEARIAELEQAIDASRAGLSSALAQVDATEHEAKTRASVSCEARARELAEQIAQTQAALEHLAADLRTATADLNAAASGNTEAQQMQRDMAVKRAERDRVIATIARVKAEAESLQARGAEIQAKQIELATLNEKIAILDTELIEWQRLARMFSRDGLPVLEIDAAGPTWSAYTNELLVASYGSRFTVEVVTQDARADGKGMREDFTIKVFDNERGGDPRDIADLSGGEKVIVSEALMNAIAIYVNQRSLMPIRTCWRDETTGALNHKVIPQYVAMLRKVQELGGFHHIFFVTHSAEAAAMADVQIHFAGGQAEIRYPPFSEVA